MVQSGSNPAFLWFYKKMQCESKADTFTKLIKIINLNFLKESGKKIKKKKVEEFLIFYQGGKYLIR